jgi:tRNA/rRNA methyltransferase
MANWQPTREIGISTMTQQPQRSVNRGKTRTDFKCLHVILVDSRNPLNMGAAARAMSNFGFRSLRVVNPYEAAFREARSARGGSEVLAKAHQFESVAAAVADCTLVVGTTAARNRELQHPVKELQLGAETIRGHLGTGKAAGASRDGVALLFGSEKFGLSNHDLSHCQWLLRIPTDEASPSMNLGQAVAVCLYELARDGRARSTGEKKGPTASAGDTERITALLMEALRISGYVKARTAASSEEKIRRMIRRLQMPAGDSETWLGMLRQLLWKLRSGN